MLNTRDYIAVPSAPFPVQDAHSPYTSGGILDIVFSIGLIAAAYLISDLRSKKARKDAESILIQELSEQNALLQKEIISCKAENRKAINEIRILRQTLDYSGGIYEDHTKTDFYDAIEERKQINKREPGA
ncbi:hypothetical protein [Argonema antarcticum]|uniref:hypothetical protein n=1 Tax=Argonema antarcticum TaxID=2942763 RepID=UPI002011C610|nr:hypothetical protein [Argonema antarcticum]MCL1474424.1 hypothetical protein [Argonema antarcticum A004/B2]